MFDNCYHGKTVVVTGNSGFKGAWLTAWLLKLGAKVVGISIDIPTTPSLFETLKLEDKIDHHVCDVRDLESLRKIIHNSAPDFVFHLAAQAIVSVSYEDPINTFTTNAMGTANVLECLRGLQNPCTAVFVTSDKCYENIEWEWGYKETDALGGKDIYSGSKAAAEVICHSYCASFFTTPEKGIRIATARAGNVIGGGDWSRDRIVVDCINAWSQGAPVELRSPNATRPWQHVLEPLSGYLVLGQALYQNPNLHGEAFNFGPDAKQNRPVVDLVAALANTWGCPASEAFSISDNIPFNEAGLLKLNCDKAQFHLKWHATLNFDSCVDYVGSWYRAYHQSKQDMFELTLSQLASFESAARDQGAAWINE